MPQNCPFDVTPLGQPQVIPNTNIFNLNYTNQDFWSLKSRLIAYCQQQFGTSFNDFIESDPAMMLVENMAFIGDTLSFKQDQIANEIFIDTVTELANAFRLCQLVGFQPQPPIAATSLWTATLNNPLTQDVTITTPYVIPIAINGAAHTIELFAADPTNAPIFNVPIVIPAGNLVNSSIVGIEGQTYIQNNTGDGTVGQNYELAKSPVIFDSIQVAVDGVGWNQVLFFTESQPLREYLVQYDSNYDAFVIFGNNQAGLIPSPGSQIQITYRVGGGSVGNIVTGFITTQVVIPVPGFAFSVPVTFTNYTAGVNGYDGDDIETIRTNLPFYLRTQNRCVTGSDYVTLASQFATPYYGQIGAATVALRNYGCAGNIIDLYVLALVAPNGLAIASDDLKAALTDQLETQKMLTDFVCIRDGIIISVDVNIEVTMSSFYAKFQQQYNTQITRQVNTFFQLSNWPFGQDLLATNLIKALSNITVVQQFTVTFTTNDPTNSGQTVTANYNEIIRPDVVTIAFVYD